MEEQNSRWGVIAAYVTIFSVIYYVVVIALLHVLRTDYDPGYRFLSEYVNGPYGELMRSTFFVLTVGTLALSLGLWRSVSSKLRFLPDLLLLVIWAGAVFLAGIYTADLQGLPPTPSGQMHVRMSMIGFPLSNLGSAANIDSFALGEEMALGVANMYRLVRRSNYLFFRDRPTR